MKLKEYPLCPRFEKAMDILGKRWTVLILSQLLIGSRRFSEIETALPISGRLLSERLKELEEEGLVTRNVYPEVPIRVEYALTTKGSELSPIIKGIEGWASNWIELPQEKN
jgi:DNA-binding HxlR family transcriptional regulator